MRTTARILFLSTIVLAAACSKVPSGIIEPETMAALMADLHTAEAVVEMNRMEWTTDSSKQALKQTVYARYGVDSETMDSSMAWYGRNLAVYMDVCDRTIEILEHKIIETGNRVAAENALSIAGDSVDVWPNPRFISINDRLPSKILTFNFARDPNWERGDIYTWRAKFFNNPEPSRWTFATEYADGTLEYLEATVSGDGWKELVFIADSTRDAVRVSGYLAANNIPGTEMRMDSVMMVRKRLDKRNYSRRYMIRRMPGMADTVDIKADSIPEQTDR